MPNQNPSASDDLRPTPGDFAEPANLRDFNDRLRDYRVSMAVSAGQYELLRASQGRQRIVDALRSLHAGGRNRGNARTYLQRVIEEARRAVPGDARPQGERATGQERHSNPANFPEPTTLGELNALLARVDQVLQVDAAVHQHLVADVGRQQLLDFIRLALGSGEDAAHGAQALRAIVADARVRVARGPRKADPSVEDRIPSDDAGDTGFSGLSAQEPTRRFAQSAPTGSRHAPSERDTRAGQVGRPAATGNHRQEAPRRSEGHNGEQTSFTPRPQARAYGKSAALCVEPTQTTRDETTVCVEVAPAIPNKDKAYDWGSKMRFHLMRKELLQMLAVLYRMAPGVHFKNHGPTKVKWLKLENQQGKAYLSMGDKDVKTLGIPISEPDVLADMAAIVLAVASQAFHGMEAQALLAFVRSSIAPDMREVGGRT